MPCPDKDASTFLANCRISLNFWKVIIVNDLKQISQPSEEAKNEALKAPNGYVYVIDAEYRDKENVPPQAISGAWKVNEHGVIIGPFIPNSNYRPKLS
jgi:hypothetical protein